MEQSNTESMQQALLLADLIRNDRKWVGRLAKSYWGFAFRATRIYETLTTQMPTDADRTVLNFGCGNQFYGNAINSDLFAPHRYLKGLRRPDLYWSGSVELKYLRNYFSGIVCEHVIEHILPDNVLGLFSNFIKALKPGGTIVVTFPDIRKVLDSNACQGFTSSIVAANSVIYRFGHVFMYSAPIVCEMLTSVGFENARIGAFGEVPLNHFLDPNREVETLYVTATKC